jgi:hypothetical protein
LAGLHLADEQPVFRNQFGRTNRVFHEIIADFNPTVAQIGFELGPLVDGVTDGFAELALGQDGAPEGMPKIEDGSAGYVRCPEVAGLRFAAAGLEVSVYATYAPAASIARGPTFERLHIRPSAVGKKNWLFVGSPEAGKRSAVIYTLLISARKHCVNPESYLQDLIERLPATCPDELDALLPANWAAANRAAHPAIKS